MSKYFIKNGNCGVETVFKMFASRWKIRIIQCCELLDGCTFSMLQERLPRISASTLSVQLACLVEDSLLQKSNEGNTVYRITDKAKALTPILREIQTFAYHAGYVAKDDTSAIEFAKAVIGNKWRSRVIWILHHNGATRFNEMQSSLEGISHKILNNVLISLCKYNLVDSKDYREKVPRVEYVLTPLGEESFEIIQRLADYCCAYGIIRPKITVDY